MDGAIDVLKKEFAGLRTGRASPNLLEPVTVEAYGAQMPINQLGTVAVPEPRMLTVQVWDKSLVGATEKAIRDAGLGLNPMSEGQVVRVPIPELNEERRQELSRVAGKYAEQAKIAVRNVRHDGINKLKRMEKEGELSQDDQRLWSAEIQETTDNHVKNIDEFLAQKQQEIMQV